MSNMRQILKRGKPSLRMVDGGVTPFNPIERQNAETSAGSTIHDGAWATANAALAAQPARVLNPIERQNAQTSAGSIADGNGGAGSAFYTASGQTANTLSPSLFRQTPARQAPAPAPGRPLQPFISPDGGQPSEFRQSLRMVDGGIVESLKRTFGMGPPETITQRYARQDAEFRAKHPQPAPAPAPVVQNTPAPMGNQNVLDKRMAAAGLEDGGPVMPNAELGGKIPGRGKGDKIHILAEPGERMVSNSTLRDNPGLGEQLDGLREQTLARQGKTVEQADAEARGGTLRAQNGTTVRDDVASPTEARKIQAAAEGATTSVFTNAPAALAAAQQKAQKERNIATGSLAAEQAKTTALEAGKARQSILDWQNTDAATGALTKEVDQNLKAGNTAGAFGATLRGGLNTGSAFAQDLGNQAVNSVTGNSAVGRFFSGVMGSPEAEANPRAKAAAAPAAAAPTPYTQSAAAFNPSTRALRQVAPPATVAGADGRKFINETVSQDDRTESDAALNSVMGRRGGNDLRNADVNLSLLAGDQNTRDVANKAWAQRGAGIRVDAGPNGSPTFSNSTGPEKMQYVGRDGKPTAEYRDTQQYTEGVANAANLKRMAGDMERSRLLEEAGSANRGYSEPARLRLAEMDKVETQKVNADKNQVDRERLRMDEKVRMAPIELAAQNRALVQQVLGTKGVDGDPIKAGVALTRMGLGHLTDSLFKTGETLQTMKKGQLAISEEQASASRKKFDGLFNTLNAKGELGDNKALEDEAHNLALQTYPDFTTMSADKQNAAMREVLGTLEVLKKTRTVDRSGWLGGLPNSVTGQKSFARSEGLRDGSFFQGATREAPHTGLEGATEWGYEAGDTRLRLPNGQGYHRIPDLSEDGKRALDKLTGQKFKE